MDWISETPRVIYSLWLQGMQNAPEAVRLCLHRWANLNPTYQVRVLDANDVVRLLEGATIPIFTLPPQALSDVVRARLLLDRGGVWVDSSVLPMQPLDSWLPEMLRDTGFFAFERPGIDRPLSSWFLAIAPKHVVMQRWWAEIERFWSKPRRLANYPSGVIPADPVACVTPEASETSDEYPYFWFHYLFQYLVETDHDVAEVWQASKKVSAMPPHTLQNLLGEARPISPHEVIAAAYSAPVQKLNWRVDYPLKILAELLG